MHTQAGMWIRTFHAWTSMCFPAWVAHKIDLTILRHFSTRIGIHTCARIAKSCTELQMVKMARLCAAIRKNSLQISVRIAASAACIEMMRVLQTRRDWSGKRDGGSLPFQESLVVIHQNFNC